MNREEKIQQEGPKLGEREPNNTNSSKETAHNSNKEAVDKSSKNQPTETVQKKPVSEQIENKKEALQTNVEDPTVCSLCKKSLTEMKVIPLESCEHGFHESCISEQFNQQIDAKVFPIKCPKNNCTNHLKLIDLMDYLSTERQEKYIISSLGNFIENNEEVCCCPTPGCSFTFLKSYRPGKFTCSLCKKTYCMSCHVEWHQGVTCNGYKNSHKREEGEDAQALLNKGNKRKQCPDCKTWISKKSSSNVIQCRCGTSFCYCCGKKGTVEKCECRNKVDDVRPIVQPELFHQ